MLQYFRHVLQKLDLFMLLGRKVPVELAPLKEPVLITGPLFKTKAKTVACVKKKSEACSQVALLYRISSIIYMWWEPSWHSQYRDKLWIEWCRVQILDLGPIQPPVRWVLGFFSRVKWQGMKLTIYLHLRLRLRMCVEQLISCMYLQEVDRDSFTFIYLYVD